MLLRFNYVAHVQIQRGGGGQRAQVPLKSHKNIGFLSNTGPDFFFYGNVNTAIRMQANLYKRLRITTNALPSIRMT